MGTTFSFSHGAGFEFQTSELLAAIGRVKPEVSHFEDRFDPKTGLKVKSVKIIDSEEETVFVLNGEEYDDYGIGEAIAGFIGCANYGSDADEEKSFIFGPELPDEVDPGVDFGQADCSGALPFSWFLKQGPELERIRQMLTGLGLKPDEPIVRIVWCFG